jgi:DNA-directed RNA polymerase specialized sigma24 family protein
MANEDETNHFLDEISGYTDEEYNRLLKKLSVYTRRIVASAGLARSGIPDVMLPKGGTVEDIVWEALADAVAGKRRWNRAKNATEFNFLCSVIRSKVSHRTTSAENRKSVAAEPPDALGDEDRHPLEHPDVHPESSASERLAATEFLEKFPAWLKSKGKDDEDLEYLIMAMEEDGTATRAEIAKTLSISPRDVDNMRKRLERRVAEFQKGSKL